MEEGTIRTSRIFFHWHFSGLEVQVYILYYQVTYELTIFGISRDVQVWLKKTGFSHALANKELR